MYLFKYKKRGNLKFLIRLTLTNYVINVRMQYA